MRSGLAEAKNLRKLKQIVPIGQLHTEKIKEKKLNLCRLGLGHTNFAHIYLITKEDPPVCSCDDRVRVTLQHFIADCKDLDSIRNNHNANLKIS